LKTIEFLIYEIEPSEISYGKQLSEDESNDKLKLIEEKLKNLKIILDEKAKKYKDQIVELEKKINVNETENFRIKYKLVQLQ